MAKHTPIKLQKNTRYPSYQLYATAGPEKDPNPEETMVICILHVYEWLRERFVSNDASDFDYPLPGDSFGVRLKDFASVKKQESYSYEIISIPEEGIWTLQLTEPDSGVENERAAVPGRVFETNIAFRIADGAVECGFRTMVTEPEDTKEKCECFRLACIKNIARDERVGLRHGFSLQDEPVDIRGPESEKKLAKWILDPERQMAVIVIAGNAPKAKAAVDISEIEFVNEPGSVIPSTPLHPTGVISASSNSDGDELDAKKLARYRMGYVQYFTVSPAMVSKLSKDIGTSINPGDVFISEPKAFGGRKETMPCGSSARRVGRRLEEFASNYCSRKNMSFGRVVFVSGAKEIESEKFLTAKRTKQELIGTYEKKIKSIIEQHKDETDVLKARINQQGSEIDNLSLQISELQTGGDEVVSREEYDREVEKRDNTIADLESKLKHIEDLKRRPEDCIGIIKWVNDEFAGRLLLHEKAIDKIKDLKTGETNVPLICDALEFLATEYLDELTGVITEDQMNTICSKKYNRTFTVNHNRDASITNINPAYKIKYGNGSNGKLKESALNYHVKIGRTAEELIRVYFLYDNEKKLIVVGSLPEHLPPYIKNGAKKY